MDSKTNTVATMCPEGDGRLSPTPYDVMSDMNPERYGEKVNRDAIKYAIPHFKMLRYSVGIGGIRWRENQLDFWMLGDGVGFSDVSESESSESYSTTISSGEAGRLGMSR
jgi:hypothetical protein